MGSVAEQAVHILPGSIVHLGGWGAAVGVGLHCPRMGPVPAAEGSEENQL